MSKALLICHRDPADQVPSETISRVCRSLAPDNLAPEVQRFAQVGVHLAIFRPNPAVHTHETPESLAVCLGHATGNDRWHDVGADEVAGTHAILRADATRIQLVTDAVASRTIWYAMDERRFVAATSQRALVALLGSFEPEPAAIPWMLATGTLGPHGWDRRLRRVGGDTVLTLDRESWSIRTDSHPAEFRPVARSAAEHEARLRDALCASIGSLHLNAREWALPLSGGYDSRGILCLLDPADRAALQAITWGLAAAIREDGNDASVARRLAEHFGMRHRYFETDVHAGADVETVIERVLVAGEGRTDALAAYTDGFAIWRALADAGIHGVIRGDEGFGWIPVVSERDVRQAVGLPLASDFANVAPLLRDLGGERSLDPSHERRSGETLETWRDRLYHEFRIPLVLAALSDLKLPYVELVNPLLGREIIRAVRELPDELRTQKALFRRIVDGVGPPVPYATHASIAAPRRLLESAPMIAFLRDALASDAARAIAPRRTLEGLRESLRPRTDSGVARRRGPTVRLRALVPRRLRDRLRSGVAKPSLRPAVLAFRLHVAARMTEILTADARS